MRPCGSKRNGGKPSAVTCSSTAFVNVGVARGICDGIGRSRVRCGAYVTCLACLSALDSRNLSSKFAKHAR